MENLNVDVLFCVFSHVAQASEYSLLKLSHVSPLLYEAVNAWLETQYGARLTALLVTLSVKSQSSHRRKKWLRLMFLEFHIESTTTLPRYACASCKRFVRHVGVCKDCPAMQPFPVKRAFIGPLITGVVLVAAAAFRSRR